MHYDGCRINKDINRFRKKILSDPLEILDTEGKVHHEFADGFHGRKLDFDKIETGTDFYSEWVSLYAKVILARYKKRMPDALVGVANGANRLSESVARLLGDQVLGLTTVKVDARTVRLSDKTIEAISSVGVRAALVIEDVSTTGSTAATAASHLREIGVPKIEAISTWQRSPDLPYLDRLGIPYSTVIYKPLPMYAPEDCVFCADGITLIKHSR